MSTMSDDIELARLPKRVQLQIKRENDCWIWQGPFTSKGWPRCTIQGVRKIAHQRIWDFFGLQPVTKATYLAAQCSGRHCVHPNHRKLEPRRISDENYDAQRYAKMLSYCRRDKETGCLLWQGSKNANGYGTFLWRDKTVLVHRKQYQWHNPEVKLTSDILIRHKCIQTTNCIEISHLEHGTRQQNAQDKDRDGTLPKGEAHYRSKLSKAKVLLIFNNEDNLSTQQLAKEHGVTYGAIRNIQSGRTWNHVTGVLSEADSEKQHYQYGQVTPQGIQAAVKRIEKHILPPENRSDRGQKYDCIETDYREDACGYKHCSVRGNTKKVHIVMYQHFKLRGNPVPNNQCIRHFVCDNPRCCNVEHMRLGTAKQNSHDRVKTAQRKEIMTIYNSKGQGTIEERANRFRKRKSYIENIDVGRSYNWLTGHKKRKIK